MSSEEEKFRIVQIISLVCGVISALGCLVIMASFLSFRKLRARFSYSLVFYLAVSDLVGVVAHTWGSIHPLLPHQDIDTVQCIISSFFSNLGYLASIVFVGVIAMVMYTVVHTKYAYVWKVDAAVIARRKYIIAAAVWAGSILISLLPFCFDAYGHVGGWCWIKIEHGALRWICFYGPVMFVFWLSIAVYISVHRALKRTNGGVPACNRTQRKMFMNLRYYPLLLLIAWFFPTVYRAYDLFSPHAPYWLSVATTFGSGLYGAMNAVLYGVNPALKTEYKTAIRKRTSSTVTYTAQQPTAMAQQSQQLPSLQPIQSPVSNEEHTSAIASP